MRNLIIKFSSGLVLFSFLMSTIALYSIGDCAQDKCQENICEMQEEMTCCDMDGMETATCQCPEMTDHEKAAPENSPAVPVTIITKLIANQAFVSLSALESIDSSKRNFCVLKTSHYYLPINKIYQQINSFLI